MSDEILSDPNLQKAVEAALKNSGTSSVAKATSLFETGKYSEALSVFKEILNNNPNSAETMTNIGNCFFKLGDTTSAKSYWEKSLQIDPNSSTTMINLGNALYSGGKLERAIMTWLLATTIEPENTFLNLNIATAYDKKNNRYMTIKYYEKFLKYHTNEDLKVEAKIHAAIANMRAIADAYVKEATTQYQKDNYKKAIELYRQSIATYPNQPKAAYFLGKIFYSTQCYNSALTYFLQANYVDEMHRMGLLDIAYCFEHLENYPKALCYYKRILEGGTINPKIQSAAINKYSNIKSKITNSMEIAQEILKEAQEYENNCQLIEAMEEYKNYLYITESNDETIKSKLKVFDSYLRPEAYVFSFILNKFDNAYARRDIDTVKKLGARAIKINPGTSDETIHIRKILREVNRPVL